MVTTGWLMPRQSGFLLSSSLLMALYPAKSMDPGLIPVTENAGMGSWLHRSQGVTDKVDVHINFST